MLSTGYRQLAYQSTTEPNHEDTPRRRTGAHGLKDRLANIVSMHIPNGFSVPNSQVLQSRDSQLPLDLVDNNDIEGMSDHFGLLSLGELEQQAGDHKQGLCSITPDIDKTTLFSSIGDSLVGTSYTLEDCDQILTCIASDDENLYVGVYGLPFVFKIVKVPFEQSRNCINVVNLHLKLLDSTDLIPSAICLNTTQGQTTKIYVIGNTTTPLNLLGCFSADGQLIAQTRKYDYQRYLAMDLDCDGNPIVACATSSDSPSAEICKLTPHFERRIFSITLRRGETFYRPEWLARSCAGGRCWASVVRCNQAANETTRRVFAFPGAQPDAGVGVAARSPKEWLQVVSWNFDSFKAGTLVALDAEHLLCLDVERRSLALITWPAEQSGVSLQRLTKPGQRTIDLVCAVPATDGATPHALFASDGDIFKFVPATPHLPSLTAEYECG